MKFACFIIHPNKNPPPQNGCRLKSAFFFKSGFTSSTFLIQPDFSQNQPATITLNTGSPQTLQHGCSPRPPGPLWPRLLDGCRGAVDPWGRDDLSSRQKEAGFTRTGGRAGGRTGVGTGPVVRGAGPGQELLLLPMMIPFLWRLGPCYGKRADFGREYPIAFDLTRTSQKGINAE